MRDPNHPTKLLLLETAKHLLETSGDNFTAETVLENSGVSKGSMYHHFNGFKEIVDLAILDQFLSSSEQIIHHLNSVLGPVESAPQLSTCLKKLSTMFSNEEYKKLRIVRARYFARAEKSEILSQKISSNQIETLTKISQIFEVLKNRGVFNKSLDSNLLSLTFLNHITGAIEIDHHHNASKEPMTYVVFLKLFQLSTSELID